MRQASAGCASTANVDKNLLPPTQHNRTYSLVQTSVHALFNISKCTCISPVQQSSHYALLFLCRIGLYCNNLSSVVSVCYTATSIFYYTALLLVCYIGTLYPAYISTHCTMHHQLWHRLVYCWSHARIVARNRKARGEVLMRRHFKANLSSISTLST